MARSVDRVRVRTAVAMVAVAALGAGPGLRDAHACVGRTLIVGVSGAPEERLLAALFSVLVTERTGTTVEVRALADRTAVIEAARRHQVGVVFETPAHALAVLGEPARGEPAEAWAAAKAGYRERFGLVWLDPLAGDAAGFSPVLADDVVMNFPALPRVVNKLSKALDREALAGLVGRVAAGEDPAAVAKEFLRARRLV